MYPCEIALIYDQQLYELMCNEDSNFQDSKYNESPHTLLRADAPTQSISTLHHCDSSSQCR